MSKRAAEDDGATRGGPIPRRVLLTADTVSGVWDHALDLGTALVELGMEVVLAVTGPAPDPEQTAAAAGLELCHVPFRPEWMDDAEADLADTGRWLLELEGSRRCDVVHLNGLAHGALPFRSPTVVAGHFCPFSRWEAIRGRPAPRAWAGYRSRAAAGLAGATRVVTASTAALTAIERYYGPVAAAEVIPHGRDPRGLRAGDKEAFVLAVGQLGDPARNTGLVARAAASLPWPVRIVPETTPAEDRAALYGAAAVFTSAALHDPFGLTVLDAALAECALVLADLPSFREQWQGAAVFVPVGDREALETALLTLMNQPELTAVLALRAWRRAVATSAQRMARRYLGLYRSLCAIRPVSLPVRRCVRPVHLAPVGRAGLAGLQVSAKKRRVLVETPSRSAEELPHDREGKECAAGGSGLGLRLRRGLQHS
jgi:glycogen(starch) synthase